MDKAAARAVGLALFFAAMSLVGCDEPSAGDLASDPSNEVTKLRVVSFSPASTLVVIDLGLADALVGVAEHDAPAAQLDRALPVVGNFLAIDYERLLALHPTHLIYPQTTSGVPERLQQLANRGGMTVVVEPYPPGLEDAIAAVPRLGAALGQADAAFELANVLRERLEQVRVAPPVPARAAPRVLLAFAVDPVMASGPGAVNDDLLALVGARNAVEDAAVSAVSLDRELLVATAPDVIVLLLPGSTHEEATAKIAWFDGLSVPAVEAGRVVALTDPLVLLPSTNLPAVAEALREAIHGVPAEVAGE